MQESTFRGFVALPVPSGIKTFLQSFYVKATKTFPDYRFVQTGNLHITLQFLGSNVKTSLIPDIQTVIQSSVTKTLCFDVSLGKASTFPEKGLPRVLYIGIDRGKEEVEQLARDLRAGLESLGFRENKPFRTHITVARRKRQTGYRKQGNAGNNHWTKAFSDFITHYHDESASALNLHWRASEVLLMESNLTPTGPVYSVLSGISLPGRTKERTYV